MAALFACGCVDLSEPVGLIPADDYINSFVSCGRSENSANCEFIRSTWAKDYESAFAGSYQGQRNVSFCLSTGCDQAIRENRILGCAWRMVIIASGHLEADESDTANLNYFCGPDMLDDAGRAAAEAQSQSLLTSLGKTN
jgi:hypothetical protein